jgi:hypothetical protein
MLIYELFQPRLEGMGFLGEKDVEEAANAAQQAAIAIAMKKAHKKPRTEDHLATTGKNAKSTQRIRAASQ